MPFGAPANAHRREALFRAQWHGQAVPGRCRADRALAPAVERQIPGGPRDPPEEHARPRTPRFQPQAGLARNPVEHGLRTGSESKFPECAAREGQRLEPDPGTARVFVVRQVTLALQPGQNPGATAAGKLQLPADFSIAKATRRLLDDVEKQPRASSEFVGVTTSPRATA